MMNSPEKGKVIPVIPGAFEMEGDQPHLIGTNCSKCGNSFFPSRSICPNCLTDEGIQKAKLSNRGKLYAYTVINVASRDFNPPYAFGFVVLDPENIRVASLLSGIDDQNPVASGMEMEMIIERLRTDSNGNKVVTYKFRPVARK